MARCNDIPCLLSTVQVSLTTSSKTYYSTFVSGVWSLAAAVSGEVHQDYPSCCTVGNVAKDQGQCQRWAWVYFRAGFAGVCPYRLTWFGRFRTQLRLARDGNSSRAEGQTIESCLLDGGRPERRPAPPRAAAERLVARLLARTAELADEAGDKARGLCFRCVRRGFSGLLLVSVVAFPLCLRVRVRLRLCLRLCLRLFLCLCPSVCLSVRPSVPCAYTMCAVAYV